MSGLHDATYGGGVGFCYDALPGLLPQGYHGPLVVALDSNILIDLEEHGLALVNGDGGGIDVGGDEVYAGELECLAGIVDLWLVRDIRFVVTPRARSDGKRAPREGLGRRLSTIDAIVASLAFQTERLDTDPSRGKVQARLDARLPDGADRELVGEAAYLGAHVFLTRDKRLIARGRGVSNGVRVVAPSELLQELVEGGVYTFGGGTCASRSCPYGDGQLLIGDMGKWAGLLSALGDESEP